ncbi:hypothetical protein KEM55_002927 [Ascosphaera atra]|nr:hypothetical protein KEM55_002927 [Ascosphaera atra]
MASLLRLASAVGPFIAVLQVHADIIDDWSPDGASQLVELSKKFSFLIWEAGRTLNPHRHYGKGQVLSPKEIQRNIELARKRYTKGVVSVASWAGIASTWVIGPEEQEKGGDRLIPTLKRAAREMVTSTTNAVRTEISAGETSITLEPPPMEESSDDNEGDDDWQLNFDDSNSDHTRKASVISLTHTITQHTEFTVAGPDNGEAEGSSPTSDEPEDSGVEMPSPNRDCPSPPVTSRGVAICVPAEHDTEYREICMNLARAHSDFIIGFVSQQAWVDLPDDFMAETKVQESGVTDKQSEVSKTFAVFAPLESEHVLAASPSAGLESCGGAGGADHTTSIRLSFDVMGRDSDVMSESTGGAHYEKIQTLHQVIARALAVKEERMKARKQEEGSASIPKSADFLCIPVISMNA